MFSQQTRINAPVKINPEPIRYYIKPLIDRENVPFESNTLARTIGTIGNKVEDSSKLRDAELTKYKEPNDLIAYDRFSLTTPHIKYGDVTKYEFPMESYPLCTNDNLCGALPENNMCDRGTYVNGNVSRVVANSEYGNQIQEGFGQSLNDFCCAYPGNSRLQIHDMYIRGPGE